MFDGASGSITDNSVTGINQGASGCQEGNAIEVRNAPFDGTHPNTQTVTIRGNTIADFQKTGILANGDVQVNITENTVTGLGPVNFIAQNGIQVGFGGVAVVRDNEVSMAVFTGPDWTSTGVLLFQADNVMVQGNAISGTQTGVAIETFCFFGAPSTASNNQVVRNTIEDANFGVTVSAFVLGLGFSSCNPSVNNNKVVNNSITNGGDTGVFVGTGFFFGGENTGFTPSTDNNKVIHNKISGYTTDIDDGGTATKVHANVVVP